jgi:hypothetical protein
MDFFCATVTSCLLGSDTLHITSSSHILKLYSSFVVRD